MLHKYGDWVVTRVQLDDEEGGLAELAVPAGTRAQIYELPDANDGCYSLRIGTNLYDVTPDEIAPCADAGAPRADASAPAAAAAGAVRPARCVVCGKGGPSGKLSRCGHCHAVGYCSRECQARDWPSHKRACARSVAQRSVAKRAEAAHATCGDDAAERSWLDAAARWLGAAAAADGAAARGALADMQTALRALDGQGSARGDDCASGASSERGPTAQQPLAVEQPRVAPRVALLARRLLFVGVSLLEAGEREEGLALLRAAREAHPTDPTIALELAAALERGGALAEARSVAVAAAAVGAHFADESGWQRPGVLVPGLRARAVWRAPGGERGGAAGGGEPDWESGRAPDWLRVLEARWRDVSADLAEIDAAAAALAAGRAPGREGALDLAAAGADAPRTPPTPPTAAGGGSGGGGGGGGWAAVGGLHRPSGQHDGSVVAQGAWSEVAILGRGSTPGVAPRTVALLPVEVLNLCEAGGGEVVFSALAPRTVVRGHCAPTNARLTAHLALEVPPPPPRLAEARADAEALTSCAGDEGGAPTEGACELRVGGHVLHWQVGKVRACAGPAVAHATRAAAFRCLFKISSECVYVVLYWFAELAPRLIATPARSPGDVTAAQVLVFDDSFEHAVRNLTNARRVVLLIRFWHPDLRDDGARAAALAAADADGAAAGRLRTFPPLALGCAALEAQLSGAAPCAACGALGAGWRLEVGAGGDAGGVVATCGACGAEVRPDR
jgi:hypothetical protein